MKTDMMDRKKETKEAVLPIVSNLSSYKISVG